MKRFVFEILIFLTFIVVFVFYLYRLNFPRFPNSFFNIDKKFEIINLGTSHGGSFDYRETHLYGQRFAKAGNTLYYDLQNYIYLKKYLKEGAIIVIPVSFFSFGLDENRTDKGVKNSFVDEFYYYLPKKQIFSYSQEKMNRLVIFNLQKNVRDIFKKKNVDVVMSGVEDIDLKEHALLVTKRVKKLGEFSSPIVNINYLSTLIRDAKESGYQPILVTIPYYCAYYEGFETDWLNDKYYNHMDKIKEKFNVPYLNYSLDKRFCYDSTFYFDSNHLSKKGRTFFSKEFFKDLKEILVSE